MRFAFPLAALALAAAPALSADRAADDAALARATAGLVAGKPVSCIDRRLSGTMTSVGGKLAFRRGPTRLYVNDAATGCDTRFLGRTLVFRSISPQMCRGDIADVRDLTTGATFDTCVLGDFTPYAKP